MLPAPLSNSASIQSAPTRSRHSAVWAHLSLVTTSATARISSSTSPVIFTMRSVRPGGKAAGGRWLSGEQWMDGWGGGM